MYYDSKTEVFLDGKWIKAKDAKASLFDQTMHYGTGVFEGLRSYNNGNGFNIFKPKEHFERLKQSAEKIHLKIPYSIDELIHIAYELITRNNLTNAYIRPLVFAGPNMMLSPSNHIHIFMTAWKWAKYPGIEPLNVMVSSYVKPSPKSIPIDAKIIGNYAAFTLATAEAKHLGYDEAILLDHNGFLSEGPGSNIFYEKDGKLVGGKFDWARTNGQSVKLIAEGIDKTIENVHHGYQGHTMPARGTRCYLMLVSVDGRLRTNLIELNWR